MKSIKRFFRLKNRIFFTHSSTSPLSIKIYRTIFDWANFYYWQVYYVAWTYYFKFCFWNNRRIIQYFLYFRVKLSQILFYHYWSDWWYSWSILKLTYFLFFFRCFEHWRTTTWVDLKYLFFSYLSSWNILAQH